MWELGTKGTLALGPWKTEKSGSQSGQSQEKGKDNVQPPVSGLPASMGPCPGLAPRFWLV